MRKKYYRKSILAFYALLLLPAIVWGVLSLTGAAKKLDYDTGEKRNKHTIEEASLGTITGELEQYYSDRVPFRSVMLSMNRAINWFVELPYSKGIQPALIAMANSSADRIQEPEPKPEAEEKPVPGETAVPSPEVSSEETPAALDETEENTGSAETDETISSTELAETPAPEGFFPYIEVAPNVIQGKDGWLFLKDEMPDYQGSYTITQEQLADVTAKMEAINAVCQSRGQTLCYLILPNKSTVYSDYMPTIDKAEPSAVQILEDYVHANSDLCFEYIDQELISAKQYGKLYYQNDTHWTGQGALTGVAALHRILGLEEIDLASIVSEEGEPFDGDLIGYSGLQTDSFVSENAIDCYYKEDIEIGLVQGQTDTVDELVSTSPDERTVVLVGDSFRHQMMPYLSKDFAHIYYINNEILTEEHAPILESADIIIVEDIQRTIFSHERFQNALAKLTAILS